VAGRPPRVAVGVAVGVAAALSAALLAACSGGGAGPSASAPPSRPAASSPAPATPTGRPADRFDTWQVGASPLPLRPDGFGEVRATPPELRVRRLRTRDLLPPPDDDRFHSRLLPVTPALARRTDLAWSPGCPVGLEDLTLLELSFWGFDGEPHTGRMVVNASVAADVVEVFAALHEARFPVEEMRLVTRADLDAPPTGDGNNTAAYACRPSVGATTWSAHAYGLAVDLNPFDNPYRKGDLVLPELASAYLDRSWRRPGMVHADGVAVRAFERIGWTWGGTFRTVTDLHHFSATGR
jgi:hypothetical protein